MFVAVGTLLLKWDTGSSTNACEKATSTGETSRVGAMLLVIVARRLMPALYPEVFQLQSGLYFIETCETKCG